MVVELLEVVIIAADGHLGQEDVREGKLLRERLLHRIGQEHALDAAGGLEVAGEEMIGAGGLGVAEFRIGGAPLPFALAGGQSRTIRNAPNVAAAIRTAAARQA